MGKETFGLVKFVPQGSHGVYFKKKREGEGGGYQQIDRQINRFTVHVSQNQAIENLLQVI